MSIGVFHFGVPPVFQCSIFRSTLDFTFPKGIRALSTGMTLPELLRCLHEYKYMFSFKEYWNKSCILERKTTSVQNCAMSISQLSGYMSYDTKSMDLVSLVRTSRLYPHGSRIHKKIALIILNRRFEPLDLHSRYVCSFQCIYICICIRTFIQIYIYIYVHMCICIYVYY